MIYVGIDNGNDGAIVALDGATRAVVLAEVMPLIDVGKGKGRKLVLNEARAWDILFGLATVYGSELYVILEKAQSMPDQGVASVFQYGTGYGGWRMALTALARTHGVQWELVHPRTWQGAVLRDIEGTDTKARAALKCARAIPTLDLTPGKKRKPHEGLADAGCMALYGEIVRPASSTALPPPPPKKPRSRA